MHLLEATRPTVAEDLALDELLLLNAEAGRSGEVLRLWDPQDYAVVLGAGGVLRDDVIEDACRAETVPILRRASGGGTVMLGPGCLCFTLILRLDRAVELAGIRTSYAWILGNLAHSINEHAPGVTVAGISDLTWQGRKISGNSQQRKREHLLHHGTILYRFDLARLERLLKVPPRQPEYRHGKSHAEFVGNLPLSRETLCLVLKETWQAKKPLPEPSAITIGKLVEEKYATEAWTRRR